jgi:hypothetical protein
MSCPIQRQTDDRPATISVRPFRGAVYIQITDDVRSGMLWPKPHICSSLGQLHVPHNIKYQIRRRYGMGVTLALTSWSSLASCRPVSDADMSRVMFEWFITRMISYPSEPYPATRAWYGEVLQDCYGTCQVQIDIWPLSDYKWNFVGSGRQLGARAHRMFYALQYYVHTFNVWLRGLAQLLLCRH